MCQIAAQLYERREAVRKSLKWYRDDVPSVPFEVTTEICDIDNLIALHTVRCFECAALKEEREKR